MSALFNDSDAALRRFKVPSNVTYWICEEPYKQRLVVVFGCEGRSYELEIREWLGNTTLDTMRRLVNSLLAEVAACDPKPKAAKHILDLGTMRGE